tara:strand:- start:1492 stop:1962 length:471 start_codon:yes stop_codon:yes gene_type:complete
MKSKRAFTLIEIMITIVVIGILTGLVAKSYQKIRTDSEYREFLALAHACDNAFKLYLEEVNPVPSSYLSWLVICDNGRLDLPSYPTYANNTDNSHKFSFHSTNRWLRFSDLSGNGLYLQSGSNVDGVYDQTYIAKWNGSGFTHIPLYEIDSIKDLK